MKFTKDFITLLRNFSNINPQMNFVPGKVQSTIIGSKTGVSFFARIKTDVDIEEQFAIMDLHRFLAIIALMEDPEIVVSIPGKQLTLSDANKTVTYTAHIADLIVHAKNPDKYKKPTEGIVFSLPGDKLISILKMNAAFKTTPDIAFVGDGKNVFLQTKSFDSPTSDAAKINIGETTEVFSAVIKAANLKILSSDYEAIISRKGFLYLGNETIEYIIPLERKLSNI